MRRGLGSFLLLLVFIAIGAIIGIGLQGQAQLSFGQEPVPSATAQTVANAQPGSNAVSAETQLYRAIYSKSNPSVVSIRVRIPSENLPVNSDTGPLPQGNQPFAIAAGSGFVYDTQGHIITNAHVVQGSDQVEVTFSDGNMMPAKITGIDLDSDLAVIQVQGDSSRYGPLPLADSDAVQVGDLAIAIGNPFEQAGSMTHGIISALNRTVQGLRTTNTGSYSIPGALQTDTPLNPGNSGGPLLNELGQVIGVNEQIEAPAGQSSGISFAIPSNLVRKIAPALIKNGRVQHPYLGISSTTLTLDINSALNLPANQRGALVVSVAPNSPAAQAGLRAAQRGGNNAASLQGGDVIVGLDNQPVLNSDDLIRYLFYKTEPGQSVTLSVLRGGQKQNIQVKLAARPAA